MKGSIMQCSDAERLIARVVDGTIDTSDRLALDAHAAACDGCRRSWAGQQAVASVLRARPASPAPAGFSARVAARLAEDNGGWVGMAEWRTWTFRLAPVMAALAFAALLTGGRTTAATSSASDQAPATDPATMLISGPRLSGDALLNLALTGSAATDPAGDR